MGRKTNKNKEPKNKNNKKPTKKNTPHKLLKEVKGQGQCYVSHRVDIRIKVATVEGKFAYRRTGVSICQIQVLSDHSV